MDAVHSSSYYEGDQMDVIKSSECESTNYTNSSHTVKVFEVLQSLREDEVSCDIRLKADDDTFVFGHKVVLMAASQYFRAMFTNFSEHKKDTVDIRELDSTILKLLVDYIYTGKIMITKQNVQVLLPAANLLQLDCVKNACVKFLQKKLDLTNCFGIRSFANLHNCLELLTSSEAYIRKKFLDVVKGDEFLSLSPEEVIELISSNVLNAPSEEKVYECVINWVKHELNVRYDSLHKLMDHVRLPLASIEYILTNVVEEPLFKNSLKCKDYIIEAFKFHTLTTQQLTIPLTIRNTPRMSGQKVILVFSDSFETHWYDTTKNLWELLSEISLMDCDTSVVNFTSIKEHFIVAVDSETSESPINILDLSLKSPSWKSLVDPLTYRSGCGFGVLNDCLYAVGGCDDGYLLNSAEVYDMSIQEWRMVSSMYTMRCDLGVGVLYNRLYAVGGCGDHDNLAQLKSVECYDPSLDVWTPVTEMSACRSHVGVGVMDGVIYAVGGQNKSGCLKSVEAYKPSSGVWTSIADMQFPRSNSSVFALDGLLYVVCGNDEEGWLDSVEIYDPTTNTWSMDIIPESMSEIVGGVIVDKALITKFHN